MFDTQTFCDVYGIAYKYGEGRTGAGIKIECPMCGGKWKVWSPRNGEWFYCNKCGWKPKSVERFISSIVFGLNPFQIDLVVNKFQKREEGRSVNDVIADITGNPSLDISIVKFNNDGVEYSEILKGFSLEQEEKTPLEWPPYYLPLGDSRIPTINMYAASRGFSFKVLSKYKFGGCSLGKYTGSLIVPAVNGGELRFWQARDALGRNYDDFPKYRTPVGYSSDCCLFNLDDAVSFPVVVICEGVFSALRTGMEAVATFGNKISENQIKLLVERGVKKVVLCFDPDTWTVPKVMLDRGITNLRPPIYSAVNSLLSNFDVVRVVRLRDGDPDDIGSDNIRKMIYESKVVKSKIDLVTMV